MNPRQTELIAKIGLMLAHELDIDQDDIRIEHQPTEQAVLIYIEDNINATLWVHLDRF